jgi:radical SAM protein with 4Fe4S-binding SPASM domain
MKEAFEKAFTELEHPDFRIDLRNGMNICELHFDSPVMTACCGIGSTHVVIQEDGKVASCSDLLKAAQQTFRISPQIRNSCEEKNCLDCRWFPVCVSGCPVNNERMTGSPFTISPLHEFYQYVIPRYVRFFGIKLLQEARRQGADASWLLAA